MSDKKEIFNSGFTKGEIVDIHGMLCIVDSIEVKDGNCRVEASRLGVISSFIYRTVLKLRKIYDWVISHKSKKET